MSHKKLLLSSIVILVLFSFPLINSVGASSEMWSQVYGGAGADFAYSLVETSDGGYALAGETINLGSTYWWVVKTNENGIIPEFPSWTPTLLVLIMLAVAVAIYKRKLSKTDNSAIIFDA